MKTLGKSAREGYVKQKQHEAATRNPVNINIAINEKQIEKEIDRVMKKIVAKLNK